MAYFVCIKKRRKKHEYSYTVSYFIIKPKLQIIPKKGFFFFFISNDQLKWRGLKTKSDFGISQKTDGYMDEIWLKLHLRKLIFTCLKWNSGSVRRCAFVLCSYSHVLWNSSPSPFSKAYEEEENTHLENWSFNSHRWFRVKNSP